MAHDIYLDRRKTRCGGDGYWPCRRVAVGFYEISGLTPERQYTMDDVMRMTRAEFTRAFGEDGRSCGTYCSEHEPEGLVFGYVGRPVGD